MSFLKFLSALIFVYATASLAVAEAVIAPNMLGLTSPPVFDEIPRAYSGTALLRNQFETQKICKTRLPTARQLAVYSQSLGARGIRETAYPEKFKADTLVQAEIAEMRKEKFYPIYKKSSESGKAVVDFYFSSVGYQRPAGELGNYSFWSSSVHPVYPWYAYAFSGERGYVDHINRGYFDHPDTAVMCLARSKN